MSKSRILREDRLRERRTGSKARLSVIRCVGLYILLTLVNLLKMVKSELVVMAPLLDYLFLGTLSDVLPFPLQCRCQVVEMMHRAKYARISQSAKSKLKQ